MYFKLLDQGLNYEYLGSKNVDGKDYDLVKVTFGKNIGDAQDIYVFYINQKTKLIDQFLFTVVGFGFSPEKPFLMKLGYETVNGIQIASNRKYINADWNGNIVGKNWTTTDWTNIKFNNAIDEVIFEKPLK